MYEFLSMLLHIDKTLGVWVEHYGAWIYLVLFLMIFAETGLIVVPFLPGDSLLFIAGAMAATGAMHPVLLIVLLAVAAVAGNTANYYLGRYIGPRVFSHNVRFLDRQALLRTHAFYEKHGGKTLLLARFIPVVRTFAPFVAGVGSMSAMRFQSFNVLGAVVWVTLLVSCGYFFGNLPGIRDHLSTIVWIGLAAATLPLVGAGLWKTLRKKRRTP